MAKIVVYSMAYRGDVFPYVPIASELSRRGHDVVYVVPREYHPLFEGEPFRRVHSGTDFSATPLDEHAAYVDRWGSRLGGAMLLRLYFGVFTIPHLETLYEAVDAEIADADLLISHPAASVVGSMSADRRGVPVLVGDLFPMILPSEHVALVGMPYLGRRVNRTLIRFATSKSSDRLTGAVAFREFRQRLGLPTDGWNVIDGRLSRTSNLGLVPSAYVEHQPDWPDNYRLVGFTPWNGPDGGHLDDDVQDYLAAGEAPVIVTLGTSAASARPEVFDNALSALDARGARGVFLASNDELARRISAVAGPQHLVRRFIALAPLLEHAAAIVHSGAHGTNSLALLAGVPSVIVPCIFDQVSHAKSQVALGTGTWVRRQHDLAGALRSVMDVEHGYAERARSFAARIAQEDGVTATADEAEALL
ncbi:MAG TPA: glycosyltransferase [Acidimicrobiales bacterium]|nr:glycosyltransferase [Acidimicrobiales bacterium]